MGKFNSFLKFISNADSQVKFYYFNDFHWFSIYADCWKVRQKSVADFTGSSTNDGLDFNLLCKESFLLDSFTIPPRIRRRRWEKFNDVHNLKGEKCEERAVKILRNFKFNDLELRLCVPSVTSRWSTTNPHSILKQDPSSSLFRIHAMIWENFITSSAWEFYSKHVRYIFHSRSSAVPSKHCDVI